MKRIVKVDDGYPIKITMDRFMQEKLTRRSVEVYKRTNGTQLHVSIRHINTGQQNIVLLYNFVHSVVIYIYTELGAELEIHKYLPAGPNKSFCKLLASQAK